ncbi:molybdate ABC transporter substrate-binding protein [Larkinella soli]|uniref:molybdate ABC transporter substrate-binding protein n=1 Tax=Larkinella soli TaxID=1770527 RepID=UPI001E2C99A8|nr:molybdate ABC transporter substrate-binding protein [Larkinella soli]
MRNGLFLLLMLVGVQAGAQKVRVAVAANAQFVMEKLQEEFERQSALKLEPIVNSSGKLTAQIRQGAPFDLFLSADMAYPQALVESGQAVGKPRIYAYGVLVLWTRPELKTGANLSGLTDDRIRKIAVANPKTAPYGSVAMEVLTRQHLRSRIESKIVYAESIAQVNQYIVSGAVEAGFTAKSVVLEPGFNGKGRWAEVPGAAPIAQGVVLLKNAAPAARKFYEFLFSARARAIFRQYGYRLPDRS